VRLGAGWSEVDDAVAITGDLSRRPGERIERGHDGRAATATRSATARERDRAGEHAEEGEETWHAAGHRST